MPRKTIKSLEIEINRLTQNENFYKNLVDEMKNEFYRMESKQVTANGLPAEFRNLLDYKKRVEGSVDDRVFQVNSFNKNLIYLLRCALNDPTIKLENLTANQLYDMASERDGRGKNPIM